MKTPEQLEDLAQSIYWQCENLSLHGAAKILDDLHSEGMRDAAEIAVKCYVAPKYDSNLIHNQACHCCHEHILSAIENKPKL